MQVLGMRALNVALISRVFLEQRSYRDQKLFKYTGSILRGTDGNLYIYRHYSGNISPRTLNLCLFGGWVVNKEVLCSRETTKQT